MSPYDTWTDGDTPPADWQPSEETRRRMREARPLDPDAHLGGEAEEREGAEWLRQRKAERAMSAEKTATIVLSDIKDPDGFGGLITALGLSESRASEFFEWSEYASLELHVGDDLTFTGRFLPKTERR